MSPFAKTYKLLKHVSLSLFIVFFSVGCAVSQKAYDVAEVPTTNNAWGVTEYRSISSALKAEKIPYTFLQDEKGKAVLGSIVSQDNLEFLQDKQVPTRERLLEYVDFLNAYNEILILYAKRSSKDKSIHSELASLMGFTLYIGEAGVDLINEFLPTIPKDDNYEARLKGLQQMYDGLTKIFIGSERSLHEAEFYSSADIRLILTAMNDTLPTLKQAFPEGYAEVLHDKLTAYQQNLQGQDKQLALSMIDQLKAN